MKRPSFATIAKVYEKKGGNVSATCTALGCGRTQFYHWRNSFPKLAEMLKEVDESLIDWAESKLIEKIDAGNDTCLIFFLKTKGKERGYVETVENKVQLNPFEEMMKKLPDNPE